jgi:hypothetical protein
MFGLLLSSIRKPNKKEIKEWLDSVLAEESDVLTNSLRNFVNSLPSLVSVMLGWPPNLYRRD